MIAFNENKAIYLQIADKICDMILDGRLEEDGRVPSVRETAADMEVNINTVNRAYSVLQTQNVIDTQRGLGYFVNKGAVSLIFEARRHSFIKQELPEFIEKAKMLNITPDEIIEAFSR